MTTSPDVPRTSHRARRRRSRTAVALAVPLGVLASGALVWQASYAAFTATTTNGANSWSTGSVTIADDDSGAVFWEVSGLSGGADSDTLGTSKCITVSYTGTMAATVDLSLATTGGASADLRPYLTLTIQEGTGGAGGGSCTGFTAGGASYTGTLDALPATLAAATDWSVTNGASRSYRISWSVAEDNLAQGKTAGATLTWTATSTT